MPSEKATELKYSAKSEFTSDFRVENKCGRNVCHLVVHWSNIHSTGKFFQIKSCGGNKMPARRLYFRVKIWRKTGRSEFPTDVPKFQLNS